MRPAFAPMSLLSALLLAAPWAVPDAAAQVRRCVDAKGNSVFTDRACDAVDATPREATVSHAGAYASGFATRGCARTPDQLLDGVRGALEARDVNRLANYYHWTGTGTGAARSLMDSLEAIAARPLVNAQLVYPFLPPELDEFGVPVVLPQGNGADGSGGGLSGRQGEPAYRGDTGSRPALGAAAPASGNRGAGDAAFASGQDPSVSANGGQLASGNDLAGPRSDAYTGTDAPTPPAAPAGPPPESLLVEQMSGAADAGSAQVRFALRRNAGCWWVQL